MQVLVLSHQPQSQCQLVQVSHPAYCEHVSAVVHSDVL
jgi:hypothetical protein